MKKLGVIFFTFIFVVSCGGGGGGGGGSTPPPNPAPSVNLSASSSEQLVNSNVTLTWSSSNATSCSASGDWSDTKSTSGSEDVTISKAGSNTYSLACSGAGGTRSDVVSVIGFRNTDGIVVDGYISGADVFIDENDNFVNDGSEYSTTSNNEGKFTIRYANGNLVSLGGTDLDSQTLLDNLLITHKLTGHSEFKAVTPVTSIEAFMEVGANINNALGIDSAIDISVTDPVANKGDGGIYDFLYEKGNQLTVLAYALQNITNDLNVTSETTEDYFKAIAEEIETEFNETSVKVDIETETFVNKAFENVIATKSVTIDEAAKANTVKALSGVLPIIEVKASDDLTTSVIRFAVSTLQEDIKAVANGTASAEKVASYTSDVIDYIAQDQNISSNDITPDISAIDDSITTAEDTPVNVQVLANDSYITTAPISISAMNGNNGTVEVAESSPEQITYSPDTDFFGSDSFSYTITQGDKVSSADVSVNISSVNDAPSLDIASTIQVPEGEILVTTVSVSDPDEDELTLTIGGTDAESFNLSAENVLSFKEAPDYETKSSYSITLSLTDGTETVDKDISILITNLNDNAPIITSSDEYSIEENTTEVGQVIATDLDGDNIVFSIISDSDLSIGSSSGIISFNTPVDYEAAVSHAATIVVSDGTFITSKDIIINVTNIDDGPPGLYGLSMSNSGRYPDEDFIDPNFDNRIRFLVEAEDDLSGISKITLRVKNTDTGSLYSNSFFPSGDGRGVRIANFFIYLDRLARSGTYEIEELALYDNSGNSTNAIVDGLVGGGSFNNISIEINNPDQETIPPELLAYTKSVSDNVLTVYSLVKESDSGLARNYHSDSKVLPGNIDYSEQYYINIHASDSQVQDGYVGDIVDANDVTDNNDGTYNVISRHNMSSNTDAIAAEILRYDMHDRAFNRNEYLENSDNPVPEPNANPVFFSETSFQVDENNVAIGTVSARNAIGDDITYSVDSAEVLIDQTTGVMIFANAPDFEKKSSYTFTVTASDGLNSTSQTITVSINDVDELSTANDCNYIVNDASTGEFRYCWEESQSTSGSEYSANIVEPLTITFADESIEIPAISYAEKLYVEYGIVLESNDGDWTNDQAYAIYQTLKKIPQNVRNEANDRRVFSKWALTDLQIQDDISFDKDATNIEVTIESSVFENANPRIATVDGKKGIYFSNKLHNALVRYVTNGGNDTSAVNKILVERYGVTTSIDDYVALTGEQATRFQDFQAEELVAIISMFEEMPSGYHKIEGLDYLVRRINGADNPYYPEAPAIAWDGSGYIEFMEKAFNTVSIDYLHRLILHEKAHFLWAKIFDDELKNNWIELGGWYECTEKESGWCTTKQTEFVSAYAHLKNPNEDMAESLSYFIVNPDALKSRSLAKYEFVRDRIMQGNIYISQIQENLTFKVYNLYPDYVFPGKVKKLFVSVDGAPTEDKTVTVEIQLHALDKILEGAAWARMRIFSTADTYFDLYLYPQNGQNLDITLRGTYTLSKYAKSGFWKTSQLVLSDEVGNLRMEGANDFGWRMYVNNPNEDLDKPLYIANSMTLTKSLTTIENQEVDVIIALWDIDEAFPRENQGCYGALNDENPSTYSLQKYSPQTYSGNYKVGKCFLEYIMPSYMPSGTYRLNYIKMIDEAGNESRNYFATPSGVDTGDNFAGDQLDELAKEVVLETSNPDITAPELDLNNISINATPTNPDNPNGETIVKFTFRVKDDISGYKLGYYTFRDPQGLTSGYYHYPERRSEIFPTAEDLDWYEYTSTVILPAGSAPGTWGVVELTLRDRALNFKTYNFTEIISFQTE